MIPTEPLSLDQVVATVQRELAGVPAAARSPEGGPVLARVREQQRVFRAEPVGGRLLLAKRVVHWFVASSFDRQAKVMEALLDELAAEIAERQRLARRVAELEARLTTLESARSGRP